ncbi:putative permease [Desulfosporosinus acidiphilus SJ4]|uniref:Putative permease n=1 Tax=Desulfosporosinus acidiphilus (strain DSM 22704 / JCM 16185 / SJ4) TaxID=646529 RepID=I4D970_DESAJ|nr:AI-2E family transporter [Desulfosporosinus acidiphilus]AFM42344.1 putative permease [Desulfosporosinus acidiphilus SJ4]
MNANITHPYWKRLPWKWLFAVFCLALGILVLIRVRTILGPFVLGFLLAYLLNPFVEGLERYGISRNKSIAIIFTGILFIIAMTIFLVLPTIYTELGKLASILPATLQTMSERIDEFREHFKESGLPNRVAIVIDQHLGQGEILLAEWLKKVIASLPSVLSSVTLYILSPMITIYLLADWKKIGIRFFRLVPQRQRMGWRRLWQDISHTVRRFVKGNLLVAVIVGFLIGIGVKLVGMDYALLIGLLCGVFDLIPYFGPFIGAVPSVLLALIKSPGMALKVVLVILVVQQIEGNLISPKLMGDSVGLHPLWIMFVLLAGGEVAGFWGLLFAVPLAAVIKVVIKHIYNKLVSSRV